MMEAKEGEILPKNWIKRESKTRPGEFYYWNTKMKQSVWKLEDIGKEKASKNEQLLKLNKKDGGKPLKKNIALERMKKLQEELKKEITKNASQNTVKPPKKKDTPKESPKPTSEVTPKRPKIDPHERIKSPLKKIVPKIHVPEPMEWEEIPQEEILKQIADIRQIPNNDDDVEMQQSSQSNTQQAQIDLNLDNFETMEQYLNYKSLVLEEQFDPKTFYLIVDTNVFISDLETVESLPKMNFTKAGKAIIVIPYVVLQELDKLKLNERLALKAKSAISAINLNIRDKNKNFIGQTTVDDAKLLIKVENADDKILNCALQRQKMGNVVLLSNDINLRTKGIVNGVDSYSTKELLDKQDNLEFL